MSLRFHEIAESKHRILNPFTEDKLMLVGEVCDLKPGMSQLDLCCGKGEMLCQWSHRYGITGIGVDISTVFLEGARQRAREMDVADKLTFIQQDAATYPNAERQFDVVSCIGATWIGKRLVGTLELMRPALKSKDSLLLVGEPYWIEPHTPEALAAIEVGADDYTSLEGTLARFNAAGFELVEMVLANQDSWDRYVASHWKPVSDWLRQHPEDPDADALRKWHRDNQRSYMQYTRHYFGWGVFVLRLAA